jgi:tRNA-dihydrouridine synthase B
VIPFPFRPPFVLAPMEGITSAAIRALLASYGPLGLVCTEFVRVAGDKISATHLRRQVTKAPNVALSVQIMGNDPRLMAEAGAFVAEAGADVVDVNLGCPTACAARKNVGAALLKQPEELRRLLLAVRGAVPGLFSAKLRAGFDTCDDALGHGKLVEACGADFLTVHPRRGIDQYRGIADWRIIALLRRELGIPVVGNGDVWYARDALRMIEETRCDAVMLGRPALRNPWIFRQIAELLAGHEPFSPSGADVVRHLQRFAAVLEGARKDAGPLPAGPLKEQFTFLVRAFPDGLVVRRRLFSCQTSESFLDAVAEALTSLSPEQLDLDARGRHGLERCGSALFAA